MNIQVRKVLTEWTRNRHTQFTKIRLFTYSVFNAIVSKFFSYAGGVAVMSEKECFSSKYNTDNGKGVYSKFQRTNKDL